MTTEVSLVWCMEVSSLLLVTSKQLGSRPPLEDFDHVLGISGSLVVTEVCRLVGTRICACAEFSIQNPTNSVRMRGILCNQLANFCISQSVVF